MSDPKKDLEIHLKATGASAAAKEVEKVEDAVEGLGDATDKADEIIGGSTGAFDAATESQNEMGGAVGRLGGQMSRLPGSIGKFGVALRSLAGGPIAIAIAAIGALVGWYRSMQASIDAVIASGEAFREANRATSDRLAESAEPIGEATKALEAHQTAMDILVAGADVAVAAIDRRASAVERERIAVAALVDSQNQLALAEGRITEDEFATRSGADKEAVLRASAAAAVAEAEAKAAEIDARIQEAGAALAETQAKLAALSAEAEKSQQEADAAAHAFRAQAAMKQTEIGRADQDGPSVLDATRSGPGGLVGVAVDYGLQMRAQEKRMKDLMAERDKLQAAADAIIMGETESDAAKDRTIAIDAATDALAASRKSLEDLREMQTKVAAELAEAAEQKRVTEETIIPTVQTDTRTNLVKNEKSREAADDKAAQQAARKAEQEDARKAREAEKLANASAREVATRFGGTLDGANAAENPELIAALRAVLGNMQGARTDTELAAVSQDLIAITGELTSKQSAAKAVVASLKAEVAIIRSQLNTGR